MARVRTPAVYRSRLIGPLLSKLRECWISRDSHLSSRSKLSAVTVAPPSRKTSGVPHGVGQLMLDDVEAKAQQPPGGTAGKPDRSVQHPHQCKVANLFSLERRRPYEVEIVDYH